MLFAYRLENGGLRRLPADTDLTEAGWIDLYRPQPEQIEMVRAMGVDVPTLAEMEEIEISNRLYREGPVDYMTVVLPGQTPEAGQMSGPVTFILSPRRLITVRHHDPRPFRTFPERAERSSAGCGSEVRVFLGLVEEIIARLADLLESSGKMLDATAKRVYDKEGAGDPDMLQEALEALGTEGEAQARVRLGLLTIERMLSMFGVWSDKSKDSNALKPLIKGMMRDIQSLEVHADFLSNRVSLISDTTLGMINLAQNDTVRIVSVVAALFLPPTLIASVYGMNFDAMPELHTRFGYPLALGAMVGSALFTYLYFKWKHWL